MMRTDEVVSLSIWLAKVGRLTSTEKIKSDTAIERIVRIFLRLLRSRLLKISVRYFVIFPCSGYAEIWTEAVAFVDSPPYLLGAGESANFCQPDAQRYNLIRSHHQPYEDGIGLSSARSLQAQNCRDSPCRCCCSARDLRRHLP